MVAHVDLTGWGTLLGGIASVAAFVNTVRLHRKADRVEHKVDQNTGLTAEVAGALNHHYDRVESAFEKQADATTALIAYLQGRNSKEHPV